ncbi:hypothetical protein [Rugamonas sp.]|uniref:hypothetical protein n=1 Tax=Rugamonas sp. TaxID=1926287 RepID=UPI0025FEEA9C|nr:hypothetical protein [Rugamonas sp.]
MRQEAPTAAELVFHPGECPAWKEEAVTPAYEPFSSLLHSVAPDTLDEARRRVAKLDRADLIQRYRAAYADGKRLTAYVMAGELIERGIPPFCWREVLALDSATINQCADLMLSDLAWLRRQHPAHASAVRYQRGKALLTGSETVFLREAEFAFYGGKRPAWKLVQSISMTDRQQWEAAYLRSTPIKRAAEAMAILSERVRQALHDNLQTVHRTPTFSEADAQASLARRHALWRCSRMVKGESAAMIAARYMQLTGELITRQAAAKQLEKVHAVLRNKGDDFLCG